MGFVSKVKKAWEVTLTSADIHINNPSKEELIDLISAALPYRDISSQITRLAVHVAKAILYQKTTTSWQTTIRDAVAEIRMLNTRQKASGVYFSLDDMHQMFLTKWNPILSWVAQESDDLWKVPALKKELSANKVWEQMKTLNLASRQTKKKK